MSTERLILHERFESIPGVKKAYFQPPATTHMEYPCVVYSRERGDTFSANDRPYHFRTRFTATVIDPDPDSQIPYYLAKFPMCTFDRHFTVDNLNHDVFSIYV